MKSIPKMVGTALRLGLGREKVKKIFGKRELEGAKPDGARGAGRPGSISLRGETQLRRLARKIQESGNQGDVTADAIYRKWKGKTCSLKTIRRWLQRNSKWARPSSKAKITPSDVSERRGFSAAFRAAI